MFLSVRGRRQGIGSVGRCFVVLAVAVLAATDTRSSGETTGSNYADAVLESGPSVYFRLNKAAGAVCEDELINAGSLTGLTATWGLQGYDQTCPVSGVTGPVDGNGRKLFGFEVGNTAAQFTGVEDQITNSADLLNLGCPTALDLESATWSFWFKTSDTGSYSRLMTAHPSFENAFQVVMDDDDFYLVTNEEQIHASTAESLGIGLNDGGWHHLCAIRMGDDAADARLFIDGAEVELSARDEDWSPALSYRIGTRATASNPWTGFMDEIVIWDRALTSEEVSTLFDAAVLIPGDADKDQIVNALDVSLLATHWQQQTDATWDDGDFNRDGMVNATDVSLLATNWQYGAEPLSSAPEPGSLVLLLGGAAACCFRARRRRGKCR